MRGAPGGGGGCGLQQGQLGRRLAVPPALHCARPLGRVWPAAVAPASRGGDARGGASSSRRSSSRDSEDEEGASYSGRAREAPSSSGRGGGGGGAARGALGTRAQPWQEQWQAPVRGSGSPSTSSGSTSSSPSSVGGGSRGAEEEEDDPKRAQRKAASALLRRNLRKLAAAPPRPQSPGARSSGQPGTSGGAGAASPGPEGDARAHRLLFGREGAASGGEAGAQRDPRGQGSARGLGVGASGRQQAAWAPAVEGEQQAPKEPRVRFRMDLPVVRPEAAGPRVGRGEGGDEDGGAFFSRRPNWARLGLTADVVGALEAMGLRRPSHVQEAMLTAWASKEAQHFIVADQAGSGKTLAYLLPIVQAIRSEDAAAGRPVTRPHSPRGVVLAPTTELVQQVYRVAKALSSAGARMRVAAMTGGQTDPKDRARSWRTQCELLEGGVDLVIATPGRFTELLAAGRVGLQAAEALVLDEVDVLMSNTAVFTEQLAPLRAVAPRALRYVFVTATLPQQTADELAEQWPDLAMATGPGLHRTAAGLTEELVDCSGGDEVSLESGTLRKLEALGHALRKHAAPRALVFCNKIEACRAVENYLNRQFEGTDTKVLVYHEAIRENLRHAAMNEFLAPLEAQAGGGRMVMVATDRMSRGIDSMYCGHVVLFDFPRDPSEYVRRVGRTARGAGGTGVVTALVMGRQVPLARDIIGDNAKGKPVHRLPQI